jgi:coenzyme F420-reducing hydrogenase delta subunit
VFFCNWSPYKSFMDLQASDVPFTRDVAPVKVMCAGRLDPAMILFAFEQGAAGVLVTGCPTNACRYGPGPVQAEKASEIIRGLMHTVGLETERFSVLHSGYDDPDGLKAAMEAFCGQVERLGPTPFVKSRGDFTKRPASRRSASRRSASRE